MLEAMTWEQFCAWISYHELDPFGESRADLRMGMETASVVNTLRQVNSTKRLSKAQLSKPTDFMPRFETVEERKARKSATTDPEAWAAMVGDAKRRIEGQIRGDSKQVH